jgi:hypothetical protein
MCSIMIWLITICNALYKLYVELNLNIIFIYYYIDLNFSIFITYLKILFYNYKKNVKPSSKKLSYKTIIIVYYQILRSHLKRKKEFTFITFWFYAETIISGYIL